MLFCIKKLLKIFVILRRKNSRLVWFAYDIREKFSMKKAKQLSITWLLNCGPGLNDETRFPILTAGKPHACSTLNQDTY